MNAATPQLTKDWLLRSFIKGGTWRILGTVDTIVLSYIFTGSIKIAAAIGGTEIFTKVVLFYLHERVWMWIPKRRKTSNE